MKTIPGKLLTLTLAFLFALGAFPVSLLAQDTESSTEVMYKVNVTMYPSPDGGTVEGDERDYAPGEKVIIKAYPNT